MTVHIENIGGGGSSTFPPKGTQVTDFSDDFNRADAVTLGPQWATWWHQADNYHLTGRPGPYQACVNPSIRDNQLVFRTQAFGVGWTSCTPWPLAWMTQTFVDQYVEADIVQVAPYADPTEAVAIWLMTCFTGNPGSFNPQFGGYIWGTSVNGDTPDQAGGGAILRIYFGWNPGAFSGQPLPEGGGIGYTSIGLAAISPNPFLPIRMRLESRHQSDGWHLTAFINGIEIGSTVDANVGPGMPGLMIDQTIPETPGEANPNRLATVDNFRAGWLR